MNQTILRGKLEEFLDIYGRTAGYYFWTSGGCASGRRSSERRYSIDKFSFNHGGKKYSAELKMNFTCQNVYRKINIFEDGEKKDIRALKKVLKQLA